MSCFSKKQADMKELRIVLLGKVGVGKSSSGNTILGWDGFTLTSGPISATGECCEEEKRIDDNHILVVVDTPGLSKVGRTNKEAMADLKSSISSKGSGPHVFLLVLNMDDRFTEEENNILEIIRSTFGKNTMANTMILFTHVREEYKDQTKEYIQSNEDLSKLVKRCNDNYHVFDNKKGQEYNEVPELLRKLSGIVQKTGGYIPEMLTKAEKDLRKQQKRDKARESQKAWLMIVLPGIVIGGIAGFVVTKFGLTAGIGIAVGAVLGGILVGVVACFMIQRKHCNVCRKTNRGGWMPADQTGYS